MGNIITSESGGFFIENLHPEIAKIYTRFPDQEYKGFDNNILVLDFGQKTREDLTTCGLKFSGEKVEITGVDSSCGCTTPVIQKLDDQNTIITVIFDNYRITNNVSKFVTVYFSGKRKLRINVIMNS